MIPTEKAAWEKYLRKHNLSPGCQACDESSYYSEFGEVGEWFCDEHEAYAHLKSFPFKKVMPCFSLDFWYSPFADLINCCPESEKEAAAQWHAWVERGSRVEELEELECQKM
jgi:hypothetical protein